MIHSAWARWRAFSLRQSSRAQCTPVLGLGICAVIAFIICWHYRAGIVTGLKIAAAVLACAGAVTLAVLILGIARDQIAGRRDRQLELARDRAAVATVPAPAVTGGPMAVGTDGRPAAMSGPGAGAAFELTEHGVTRLDQAGEVAP